MPYNHMILIIIKNRGKIDNAKKCVGVTATSAPTAKPL